MRYAELIQPSSYIIRPWWLGAIPKAVLPEAHKVVWCALADRLGENEVVWPNLHRISFDSGIPRSDVVDAIKRLKVLGLLTYEEKGHRAEGKAKGRKRSNCYTLLMPAALQKLYKLYLTLKDEAKEQHRDLTPEDFSKILEAKKRALVEWGEEVRQRNGLDIMGMVRRGGCLSSPVYGTTEEKSMGLTTSPVYGTFSSPVDGTVSSPLHGTGSSPVYGTQTPKGNASSNAQKERPQITGLTADAVSAPPLAAPATPAPDTLLASAVVKAEGDHHVPSGSINTQPPEDRYFAAEEDDTAAGMDDDWDDGYGAGHSGEPAWETDEYEPNHVMTLPPPAWAQVKVAVPATTGVEGITTASADKTAPTPVEGDKPPERASKRLRAVRVKQPVTRRATKAPPLTDEQKTLACTDFASMKKYLLYGAEAFEPGVDLEKLKPTKANWLKFMDDKNDHHLELWTPIEFAGFFWCKVTEYRVKNEMTITLPDWGRLMRHMSDLSASMNNQTLFNYLFFLTEWFVIIRLMNGGAGRSMTLNEAALSHSLIKMSVENIMSLSNEQRNSLWRETLNKARASEDD